MTSQTRVNVWKWMYARTSLPRRIHTLLRLLVRLSALPKVQQLNAAEIANRIRIVLWRPPSSKHGVRSNCLCCETGPQPSILRQPSWAISQFRKPARRLCKESRARAFSPPSYSFSIPGKRPSLLTSWFSRSCSTRHRTDLRHKKMTLPFQRPL